MAVNRGDAGSSLRDYILQRRREGLSFEDIKGQIKAEKKRWPGISNKQIDGAIQGILREELANIDNRIADREQRATTDSPLQNENFGTIIVRAFWKYKNERASNDPRREVDADVFIKSNVRIPYLDSRFEFSSRGYFLGRTPLEVSIPVGKYTLTCEYGGTGRFEQRIQNNNIEVKPGKRPQSKNFYFEVIESGGQGGGAPPRREPRPEPEPVAPPEPEQEEPRVNQEPRILPSPKNPEKPIFYKVIVDSYPTRDVDVQIEKIKKERASAIIRDMINSRYIYREDLRDMNGAPLPALTGEEESSGVVRPADPILNQIYGHILEQADRPEELAKRLLPLLQSYYDSSAVTAQYYRTRNAAPIVDLVIERIKQQGTISAPLKPSTAYRGSTRLRQRGYFGSIRASVHGPEFKDFLTPFEDEFKADNIEIDGNTGKKIYTGTYTFEAQDTFEAPVDDFTQNIPGKKEAKTFKFFRWEVIRPTLQYTVMNLIDGGVVRPSIREENGPNGRRFVEMWPVRFRKLTIDINEIDIKLIAYYHADDSHTQRPIQTGLNHPYSAAAMQHRGIGAKDRALASGLGNAVFRKGGIDKNADNRAKIGSLQNTNKEADPLIQAAANKGKRVLNQYVRAEYTRIFDPLIADFRGRRQRLRELAAAARQARRNLRRALRNSGQRTRNRFWQTGVGQAADQDLMNEVQRLQANNASTPAMMDFYREIDEYTREYNNFQKEFSYYLETASAQLKDKAQERAGLIAVTMSRRFRVRLNNEDQKLIEAELQAYAIDLAEKFPTRGRTNLFALTRGLDAASRGLQTIGSGWNNIWYNLWNFITGPWTIATIFAIVQFFFTLTFVGYDTRLLWTMPMIAGIFTFLLNFQNTTQPFDWWAHFASGAVMGYSAMLLLMALGLLKLSFFGGEIGWTFWIIWGVLALMIGNFQFYQTGGFGAIAKIAVVVLLFAYVALGPYSAYYQQAIGQVTPAVETGYHVVKNAVSDVYLLATNPTQWYARQQVVNTRPEKPIDFAKGIEIKSLDSMPQSVPSGLNFVLAAVIKNEGELAEANHTAITIKCNNFCNDRSIDVTPFINIEDPTSPLYSDPEVVHYKDFVGTSLIFDSNAVSDKRAFYVDRSLGKGESNIIRVQPFLATSKASSAGEAQFAKIAFGLTYVYGATSSLLVSTINENALSQQFAQGNDVFHPVLATAKVTPAKLSLNVGPQPLVFRENDLRGNEQVLLVSVSNSRDDSKIILPGGSNIQIKFPAGLVEQNSIDCGPTAIYDYTNSEFYTAKYIVRPTPPNDHIEIKPYDFNSIFAFICKFKLRTDGVFVASSEAVTNLITAEIPEYIVKVEKEKQVLITPPLGVIYDPFEQICNKETNPDDCHNARDGNNNKCWYELPDSQHPVAAPGGQTATNIINKAFSNVCHACGTNPQCGMFVTDRQCNEEQHSCGLTCTWQADVQKSSTTGLLEGKCVDSTVVNAAGKCDKLNGAYADSYVKYSVQIRTYLASTGLDSKLRSIGESNPEAFVSAIITQESIWNERASGDSGNSVGLMQIYVSKHPECDQAKLRSFDVDENLRCGMAFLGTIIDSNNVNIPKQYSCNGKMYSNGDAALRWYNGWPNSGCSGDPKYVDSVRIHYSNFVDCFNKASASVPGDPEFCFAQRLTPGLALCQEGNGGCGVNNDCDQALLGDINADGVQTNLVCRHNIGTSKGICCFADDINNLRCTSLCTSSGIC